MIVEIREGSAHKTIRNVINARADIIGDEENGEALILFYEHKTRTGKQYCTAKKIDRTAEVIIKQG